MRTTAAQQQKITFGVKRSLNFWLAGNYLNEFEHVVEFIDMSIRTLSIPSPSSSVYFESFQNSETDSFFDNSTLLKSLWGVQTFSQPNTDTIWETWKFKHTNKSKKNFSITGILSEWQKLSILWRTLARHSVLNLRDSSISSRITSTATVINALVSLGVSMFRTSKFLAFGFHG